MKLLKHLIYTVAFLALPMISLAQKDEEEPPVKNWQNLDLKEDGVFGISTEKTYQKILKKMIN